MRSRCALFALLLLAVLPAPQDPRAAPGPGRAPLTFAERVEAQEAILRVMASHTGSPSTVFEKRVPRASIEARVRRTLAESRALEVFWNTPITAAMLEAEVRRMVRDSVMPARLRERFEALGNDPVLIREMIARPVLADRLVRNFFAWDRRIHAEVWEEADDLRRRLAEGRLDPRTPHAGRTELEVDVPAADDAAPAIFKPGAIEEEVGRLIVDVPLEARGQRRLVARYAVEKLPLDAWLAEQSPRHAVEKIDTPSDPEGNSSEAGLFGSEADQSHADLEGSCVLGTWSTMNASMGSQPPLEQRPHGFWTGNELLLWGDQDTSTINPRIGGRYDPATASWSVIAPSSGPTNNVSAVWTGTSMLTFGGSTTACCCQTFFNYQVYSGGLLSYDPLTDTWEGVGGGLARAGHTAVWTGKEMIVWGGFRTTMPCGQSFYPPGQRYNPATQTWTNLSSIGAPALGQDSAFTTGFLTDQGVLIYNDTIGGYLYHPETDTWTRASTVGGPAFSNHTAVAGGRFVALVSGGGGGYRYDPINDHWSSLSPENSPSPRCQALVASSGTEILWWGGWLFQPEGQSCNIPTNTGTRYDPVANVWHPTSSVGAPPGPVQFGAPVWTGEQMIWWAPGSSLGYAYCMPGRGPCFRDLDLDGYGDPGNSAQCNEPGVVWNTLDCDDGHAGRGGVAQEVSGVRFGHASDLAWDAPASPAADAFYYDVLRSDWSDNLSAAACVATDITELSFSDPFVPSPGAAKYYQVRASTCPGGTLEGPLGHAVPSGAIRVGPVCP